MKRTIVILILTLVVVSSVLLFTDRITRGQEEETPDITAIEGKIDDLLKGQKEILQQIELIKKELEIIKIRVTQRV